MKNNYTNEREGQLDFYNDYLPLIDKNLKLEDVLVDNNDGILRGNIIEFKIKINDLNSVLFQAIKYLSARRVKGKPIPSNIILVSLNNRKAYYYHSKDYLKDIEQVYLGGASKENAGFQGNKPLAELDYYNNKLDEQQLIDLLKTENYTKIHIDENCIVGWAKNYYDLYPNARKSDFIGDLTGKVKIVGEIREPNKFKDFIYPYESETNVKFQYLMDKLNDELLKKDLGAFYTPIIYSEQSLLLLREAINRVPKGNDYIILDRCAGTGNLEKKLTEDELKHVIVSTVEYYEYKVLLELLGDKVRYIIPPTEKKDTFNMGLVKGADALSKEYIENEVIKQYVDDPKTTVILFENPPYAETNGTTRGKGGKATWKDSYVVKEMKKEVSGVVANDLGNAFIWSAFKYYLRQPTDSYVVYSPVKYWKAQHLVDKKFIKGFAFNRRHFHTNIDACIMVALWSNEDDKELRSIKIEAFNILELNDEKELINDEYLDVKKSYKTYSQKYYDKRSFKNDELNGIAVNLNGTERNNSSGTRVKKIYNDNVVGYLVANGFGFDNPDLNSGLTIAGRYDGNGFFLRKDNYLEKLPMFSGSRYITYNREWTERARIMKTADGSEEFNKDVKNGKLEQFLLKNLLFTILETQNHIRSFTGSDGRFYKNELCLDKTNGETIASLELKKLNPNEDEIKLLKQWDLIIDSAKKAKNYNKELTYGIYQIQDELNTYKIIENGINKQRVYDYPELNGHLITLKSLIKDYYLKEIVPTLFKYEFLK